MMSRNRHPHKEIEKVVAYAESQGWRLVPVKGHAWGCLYCPRDDRTGCRVSVWSTPRNPENHARQIRRQVDSCPHMLNSESVDSGGERNPFP